MDTTIFIDKIEEKSQLFAANDEKLVVVTKKFIHNVTNYFSIFLIREIIFSMNHLFHTRNESKNNNISNKNHSHRNVLIIILQKT